MVRAFKTITIFGLEITSDGSERSMMEKGSILLLILMGFTAFDYIYNGVFRPLATEKVDFLAYYNASLAFRYGFPLYEPMVRFFQEGPVAYNGPFPYVYPPFFVIFLSPLAYLNLKQAILCWNLVNHFFFFGGLILLMKSIARKYSLTEWLTMIFICMNFTPLFIDYLIGQCNIILFFFYHVGTLSISIR